MNKYPYASVQIGLVKRFEYYYGDVDLILELARKSELEITNPLIERVNIRFYKDINKMLEYIDEKKAFYENAINPKVKFIELKLSEAI